MNRVKKKLVSLLRNLFKDGDGAEDVNDVPQVEEIETRNEEPAPQIEKEPVVSRDQDEKDLERLEKLLKQALFGGKDEKVEPPTSYILNSSDDQWFYAPNSRTMVRIPGGSQLIVSDPTPNDDGKVLCYCDFGFIMVPSEEISPLGYN